MRAAADRPELLYQLHALKNWEVRQAAINAGIDLGERHVGSRQGLGEAQVSRQDLFRQMLERGVKPEDIPGLAKPPEGAGWQFTRPLKMYRAMTKTLEVLHHELAHGIVAGWHGIEQLGIMSHHHPDISGGAAAAAMMNQERWMDANGDWDPVKVAPDVENILEIAAAGVAVNELIDGVPRAQNRGGRGDRAGAEDVMHAANIPLADRPAMWNAAIDRVIAKLGPIADMIRDEASRREDNLRIDWHFSKQRVENIVLRAQREALEQAGQQPLWSQRGTAAQGGGPGTPQGLAPGQGAGAPVGAAAATAPKLKRFIPPKVEFTVAMDMGGGRTQIARITAINLGEVQHIITQQFPQVQRARVLVERPLKKPGPIALPYKEGESPLKDMVSREESEGRLRRKQNREEGVGDPRNEAHILTDAEGRRNFFGRLTPEQEKERITAQMDDDEIRKWRDWYPRIRVMFREMYGAGPKADKEAAAWAISQKGVGPARGKMDVERTRDIMGGQRRFKGQGPGMQEEHIRELLSGETPTGGVGAKLHDFMDSVFERPTRTVMNDRPEGGQPAAIDVHGARGAGYVDQELINAIEKKFGKDAARGLVKDFGVKPSETQYERSVDYYNDLAKNFNASNFKGGGWNAEQAQSVVWGAVGKQIGRNMQLPDAIFDNNIRRISSEVNPQPNSWLGRLFDWGVLTPEQAAAVTRDYTQEVMKIATKEAGGRVSHAVYGPGGWMDRGRLQVSPAAGTHLLSSPEAAERVANLAGYFMGQQEILVSRPLASGAGHLIEITEVGSTKMAQPEMREAFFQRFNEHYPEATGFAPTRNRDGSVGIQILQTEGHPTAEQFARAQIAAAVAGGAVGIEHVTAIEHPAEVTPVVNMWEPGQSLNGEAFLNRLREIGKPGILGRIRNEYRPLLERKFMDSVRRAITRVREPGG